MHLLSVAGWTSPETATLSFCPQAPLGHSNSVGFGVCRHDVSSGGAILSWPFSLCSSPLPVLPLDKKISGKTKQTFEMGGWLHTLIRALAILRRWSPQVLAPPSLCITAKVNSTGSWEPHISLVSGTIKWLLPVPHPLYYVFFFNLLTLCSPLISPPVSDTATLISSSSFLPPLSCSPSIFHNHLVPPLNTAYTPLSSFLLCSIWSAGCIICNVSFWVSI